MSLSLSFSLRVLFVSLCILLRCESNFTNTFASLASNALTFAASLSNKRKIYRFFLLRRNVIVVCCVLWSQKSAAIANCVHGHQRSGNAICNLFETTSISIEMRTQQTYRPNRIQQLRSISEFLRVRMFCVYTAFRIRI